MQKACYHGNDTIHLLGAPASQSLVYICDLSINNDLLNIQCVHKLAEVHSFSSWDLFSELKIFLGMLVVSC